MRILIRIDDGGIGDYGVSDKISAMNDYDCILAIVTVAFYFYCRCRLQAVIGYQFLQRCWQFIENLFNGVNRCGQILHLIRWDFDFAILSINP
ncbi:hypothetical protein OSB04_001918 [Centaurea solstitialis]|uniref:Uncharacterized protein n=1 Tax=Centaurea solstitialis TaxID=347529 RepID=A0AA38WLV2_9ASTR|nr:hypothetical protein OSB04_001918 [Centaurea solstitialis]